MEGHRWLCCGVNVSSGQISWSHLKIRDIVWDFEAFQPQGTGLDILSLFEVGFVVGFRRISFHTVVVLLETCSQKHDLLICPLWSVGTQQPQEIPFYLVEEINWID